MGRAPVTAEWLQEDIAEALSAEPGIDADRARHLARQVLARLTIVYGTDRLYIPSPRAARHARIRAEFNGRNADDLAAVHGVARSTIYRIVGKIHAGRK